jgi:hypothetical protein
MAITSSNATINKLMQSPTGMKLLQEAQNKGVKINFAQNNGDNVLGQYNPNNNTITVENGNMETMVETLAHELVHATTRENGNSMNEETTAFIIGEQVAKEAGVDTNPHNADFWQNHVANSYKGLAQDNGIMGALNALGIAANEAQAKGYTGGGNNAAAPALNYADAANAAGNVNLAQAANDPFTAAMNQAAQIGTGNAANTAANANPLNNQQQANPMAAGQDGMMQMLMMILQMIMQMLGQAGLMNNQQQGNQQNPLANPQTAPQAPQTNPQQQQHKMFVAMSFTA